MGNKIGQLSLQFKEYYFNKSDTVVTRIKKLTFLGFQIAAVFWVLFFYEFKPIIPVYQGY